MEKRATPTTNFKHHMQQSQKETSSSVNEDQHPDGYKVSIPHEAIIKHQDMIKNMWPVASQELMKKCPEFAKLYTDIRAFNQPNCVGSQCSVKSALRSDQWQLVLQHYHDREVCSYIKYGWPVGFMGTTPPSSVTHNHKSAIEHPEHVKKFIETELAHGAILGPFKDPPFEPWCRISPLMTRPKRESNDRRVIVDMSFPKGEDVNSGIDIADWEEILHIHSPQSQT